MLPWLARIVDLDNYDFTTLLAATTWFWANPRSGLTSRVFSRYRWLLWAGFQFQIVHGWWNDADGLAAGVRS